MPTTKTVSAREYIRKMRASHEGSKNSFYQVVAKQVGVSAATLRRHVEYSVPISPKTAGKLQTWSGGKISGAKTIGLK